MLAFIGYEVAKVSQEGAGLLYVRGNGQLPELPLAAGRKFHLFLSHVWGSGQDQAAVIKRQLQLCLPGVSVFLDVDDLNDISALETCEWPGLEPTSLAVLSLRPAPTSRLLVAEGRDS